MNYQTTNNKNPKPNPDEFTDLCTYYYRLTELLAKRRERLYALIENAPLYNGETNLSEIDAIIVYYRKAQILKAKLDKTHADLAAIGQEIVYLFKYFGIPTDTILTGQIPFELEYEIFIDEDDTPIITKTKTLEPEVLADNIILVKFSMGDEDVEED
jgi:hypothetical protein